MAHGDGTMTTVEQQVSSTSQLDSAKGNGHVQPSVSGQSCFENGEPKAGNIQATLESSTFGVILRPASPYGTEATLSRKPDRVKIIVKRKVVADESGREGRISSPSKKHKASGLVEIVGEQGLSQLNANIPSASSGKDVRGPETALKGNVEKVVKDRDTGSTAAPLSSGQSLGSFGQNSEVPVSTAQHPSVHSFGGAAGDGNNSASYAEPAALPATSASLPSSSPSSPQPNFGWEPSFSQNELSALDQVSNWEVKNVGPTGAERDAVTVEEEQLRRQPPVDDGAEKADSSLEPASPSADRAGSGGVENPHTPKARRTPLCFPPLDNTSESFLLPSPSQAAANPPAATSSPAPAKRFPLPGRRPAEPSSRIATPDNDKRDDGVAKQYGHALSDEQTRLSFMQVSLIQH